MIFAHKLTPILLTTLLLSGCHSFPTITISIESKTSENEVKQESTTRQSEPEEHNNYGEVDKTITQSQSSSPSACSSTTTITESNRINLLQPSNGGHPITGSGTYWSGLGLFDYLLIDAEKYADEVVFQADEVVYGFKDGSCATFDNFVVLMLAPKSFNEQEFELFVGNDSPTGKFELIAKFNVRNQIPIQTLNFEPKVGRYFKVKKVPQEKIDESAYRFQLLGALE